MTYNDSQVETYNFAVHGATVDKGLIDRGSSLSTQVGEKFLPNYDRQGNHTGGDEIKRRSRRRKSKSRSNSDGLLADWEPKTTLFSIWFGINDNVFSNKSEVLFDQVFESYNRTLHQVRSPSSSSIPPFSFSSSLRYLGMNSSGSLAIYFPQLHTAGAQNFLLLNVPPINRGPNEPPNSQLAKSIPSWNARLAKLAALFGSTYPKTSVFVFDAHDLFIKILNAPADFAPTRHLSNLKDQCDGYVRDVTSQEMYKRECGVPFDQYFWRDGLHVTFPVHQVLAQELAGLLRGV